MRPDEASTPDDDFVGNIDQVVNRGVVANGRFPEKAPVYAAIGMDVNAAADTHGSRVDDANDFVAGVPSGIASTTNVMKIHRIGEEVKMH